MSSRFIELLRQSSKSIYDDESHSLRHHGQVRLIYLQDESKHGLPQMRWAKQSSNSLVTIWTRCKVVYKFLLFFVLFFILISPFGSFSSIERVGNVLQDTPHHMHVVISASQANSRFCKTLLSTAVLDYPSPIIVNWKKGLSSPWIDETDGSHIVKIQGVLDYIDSLGDDKDDDLLLLVDGYDVLFQLRPEVMIKRYYDINARANKRIRNQLGTAAETELVSQRVLFSAQKNCWPTAGFNPKCWALPESSLPHDVYGPGTDTDLNDPQNKYVAIRQRYLNSGLILGPVGDLRKIYQRAKYKVSQIPYAISDQGIMAEIFGEQEVNRLRATYKYRSKLQRLRDWISERLGIYHNQFDHATDGTKLEGDINSDAEFGIGLDYENSIMHTSIFAEDDIEWLRFNDQDRVDRILRDKDIDSFMSRKALARGSAELATSRAPFSSLDDSTISFKTWNDVSLSVNVKTGTVPALIHFNGAVESRLETDWPKTWFYERARALLNAHVVDARGPVAMVEIDGMETEWWGEDNDKASVFTDAAGLQRISNVCNGTWEELFGDGRGTWVDPRESFG